MPCHINSLLETMWSGVGIWASAPTTEADLDGAAKVMSEADRLITALEGRLRRAGWAGKLGAAISILIWLGVSLLGLLFLIPWSIAVRARQDRSNSKMILLVSHESVLLGGAPQSLLTIVQGLDRRLFTPVVVTGSEGPFAERSRGLDVRTFVLPLSFLLRLNDLKKLPRDFYRFAICLPFLLFIISHLPIRLVHNNSLVSPDAAIAAKLLRIPIVWHFRETLQIHWWEQVQLFVLKVLAHRIVCNSWHGYHVVARHRVPEKNLKMVYNCVSEQYFRPRTDGRAYRRSLNVGPDHTLIGCVGRVSFDKGHDILVRAATRAAKAHPDVNFVFVGAADDSDFVRELVEYIDGQGLQERIRLTPPSENIPEVMSGLDIHVTASRGETFGRVALEAMAGGALSIVSDCGGLPEIVEHGVSGLVFEGGNVDALSLLLDEAISDKELRERLGRAGNQRAREVFGCKQHVQKIEGIYRELIDPSPSSANFLNSRNHSI